MKHRWARCIAIGATLWMSACSCQPELPDDPVTTPPLDTATTQTTETADTGADKPCDVPEVEPNGSVDEATELPMERLGCGVFSEPFDTDVFVTTVPQAGWLSVATSARAIGSLADMQVLLKPPTGAAVYRWDDEGGTTDASLLFPAEDGLWEIQLTEQNFQGSDDYFYEVAVSTAKAPVEWTMAEVEPNDGVSEAMSVSDGDAVFGDRYFNLDLDWFRIDVPPGKHTVQVAIDGYTYGSAGDFSLWLYDATVTPLPLGCDDNIDDGIQGAPCEVTSPPLDPGIHDPVLEYESLGDETLYFRIDEADLHWGSHTWYVARVTVEGA